MQALVLGGTGWLGRAIVRDLLGVGVEVTCLARGATRDAPDGARLVRTDRRADGAYGAVAGEWDEVVELSSDPELVRPALDALADSAAHWTLVSTVSVYARNDEPGADESATVVEPADLTQYADAKVAAERSSAERLGSRLLVARPGLIVGRGDPSDRFGYWPARLSRPGPVLVPTSEGRSVQVIDVADLAAWVGRAGRSGHSGIVNAVGEVVPMRDFFRLAVDSTGFEGELVEVQDDVLLAHDVQYWAGSRSLPLWLPHSDAAMMHRSAWPFHDAGGRSRPLTETLAGVLADERDRGVERPRRAGLGVAEEVEVLAAVR